MAAIAKLAYWGNCLALRIPSSLAREVCFEEGTSAKLSVVKGKLVVAPVDETPVYRLSDLVAGITDENLHGEIGTGAAVGREFS